MIWLTPLALLFGLIVRLRNFLFEQGVLRQHKLPGRVISVGNIAVGGTGKSPIVMDLAERIQSQGGRPAIISRGYKSGLQKNEWQILLNGVVVAGVSRAEIHADESRMQSLRLPEVPVVVGAKRFRAAGEFLKSSLGKEITHWILDDGFQHRQIARDADLVVMDARSPSGWLLPAGRFREPLGSLHRATGVVLTKYRNESDLIECKQLIEPYIDQVQVFTASFKPSELIHMGGLEKHKPSRWAMVSGIANPVDFEMFLHSRQIQVTSRYISADHESVSFDALKQDRRNFDAIVTTEKDWARDEYKFLKVGVPIYVLSIQVEWMGGVPLVF